MQSKIQNTVHQKSQNINVSSLLRDKLVCHTKINTITFNFLDLFWIVKSTLYSPSHNRLLLHDTMMMIGHLLSCCSVWLCGRRCRRFNGRIDRRASGDGFLVQHDACDRCAMNH
eukprot:415283_1